MIRTQQGPRTGSLRSVRRFVGWLLTLTMSSLLLLGCTTNAPFTLEQRTMPVPSAPSTMQDARTFHGPSAESVPMEMESAKTAPQTPIYWLGATERSVYLYREFREVPSRGDPITTALAAMTSEQPLDADYFNPWMPAETIAASVSGKNLITVDISKDAFAQSIDRGLAERAVQQLVFTATAAAASSGLTAANQQIQVVILVDGRTGYEAFGHVRLGERMVRHGSLVAPVWVIDPEAEAVYPSSEVTVKGRGASADSILSWQLRRVGERADGERFSTVHSSGSTRLDEDESAVGNYSFTLVLGPGDYEIRVFDRASGTESQYVDSKDFTVR